MMFIRKKGRQFWLSLLLCTCLVGQISVYPAWANDRSAEIIGSSPLLTPGIITPSGLSGKGQLIGIADSGLDNGSMSDIHPDLQTESGGMPKVILRSYTDRESADDPIGHGTFMAATIAGTGKASNGKYQGIAPGARIYFQSLLDKNNSIAVPDRIEDLFGPAYSAGVRIHVDGWGSGINTYSSSTADIDKFIYYHPDFLPVFSTGNSGPGSGTLTSQANSKNALVVGSSQVPRPAFDPESNYADQAAASSSTGPTADGRIKPDLLAPGSSLISACSSLVESNFAGDSDYTRMGGSSMAAAVTGGALALLREQLNTQLQIANPSAALLKALFINGARSIEGNINQQGYGILDSAGTALSLKEGTVDFSDSKERLKAGESRQYKFQVTDPSMPVKITLAWTDPPGTSGAASALVNNLDLVVQAPGGKIYYGNDFNSEGKVDTLNNVEQVSLKVPQAGEYTISVNAANINSDLGQDFALAYGQILKTEVVQEVSETKLLLADGTTIDTASRDMKQVLDGVLTDINDGIQVGSDIYLKSDKAYIFGDTWYTGGIQALSTDNGDMLLEMNNQARDGGYYLDEQAAAASTTIYVNGIPVSQISAIPTGSELKAAINPFLQTIWKLEAANREVKGIIAEVDPEKHEFKLLDDPATYKMASWGAISYQDKIVDCTLQDTPFGAAEQNDFSSLMPGSKVTLQVSPQSGAVQLVLLERPIAIGRAREVFISEGKIELDTGKTYTLFPGTSIIRNGENVALNDIQVGDRLIALLLPDSNTIIQLQAYSEVVYGRVVYYNSATRDLYLIDANNRSHTYSIDKQTGIYGWGIPLESNSIASGSWVRVIGNPAANIAQRVDVAEIGQECTKTLAAINYQTETMTMTDNSTFKYNYFTRISKGGYIINPEDILIGEKITLTTLMAPSSSVQPLVDIDIDLPLKAEKPSLQVTARSLNGALIIEGTTSADCIYLYRQDGSRERVTITKGSFTRLLNMTANETEITVVALDTSTGAIQNRDVQINEVTIGTEPAIFTDIAGHWAESYIVDLARRNVIKGYEDGSFRPDQTISRAELMVIIAQLLNWEATVIPPEPNFTDYQDIPWWSLTAVMAAREKGIIYGYPDGSFNPYGEVTRSELTIICSHITKQGLANLFPDETSQPDGLVTRGQVMAILDRL